MKPIHQYVNNKTSERYYYESKPISCEVCENQLGFYNFMVLHLCWSKKKSYVKKLCFSCSKKQKQETEVEERIPLLVVNKKPKNSKLVLITQPELKNSSKDSSVFSNTLESVYVNNKDKRSGHPDYTVLDDNAPVVVGLPFDAEKDDRVLFLEKDEDIKKLLE